MRSLSITALMILAAFVLGLALGGQMPREAAAAQDVSEGIGWENDGQSLTLINMTQDGGFVALGELRAGATALPSHVNGILKIPVADLKQTYVYRLEPVWACDPRECRFCDGSVCPIPPRPPINPPGIRSVIDQFQ